ncbi:PAS domain S-box protein [Belnapia sp. T6]|uniref:histidine kinase n=1 Tax=Belnapia mucosa TaxID=2804532 RepID=A0ABS1UWU1_9PROT|nr:PAS domain S-box protein [Belnapia mucosa]MBL6453777.1 PAS domain S-box protein [Belnapia mucosa]
MPEEGRKPAPDMEPIRAFAEESPAAVAVLSGPAHRLLYVNPAFALAAGQAAEMLCGRSLAEVLPDIAETGFLLPLDQVRSTGRSRHAEALPIPLGRSRLWDAEASPLRGRDGSILGVLVQLRDATRREARLRRTAGLRNCGPAGLGLDARYRALVEAGALAVWTATTDGAVIGMGGWAALTGQTPAGSAGWGWLDAVHPEEREATRERWTRALATGGIYEAEYRLCAPNGRWRWTAARAAPVRDAEGRILEWLGVNTDIDSRKRTERALRDSEARFRTLAEAMPHLVWQTDPNGVPSYLNSRWEEATGLGLEQLRGGGWASALHPDDRPALAAAWARALAEGGEYDADARIRDREGCYRWHRIRAAPVRNPAGAIRHWVGTCTDIEERHRAEAQLREALVARETISREAEHRMKNSLQLVAALLRLQAGRVAEPAAREALDAATARVQAVAEAHRALQRSPDHRSIRLSDMLRELAAGATVQHPGADIRIAAPEDLQLDAERAIPLALILSELVTQALHQAGPVLLSARREGEAILAEVTEPPGAEAQAEGLGSTVIRALARQIAAELVSEAAPEGGRRMALRLAADGAGR